MTATFDSIKEPLLELLKQVCNGNIQLSNFQRGWIWDYERIRSLLASVCLSYPIGSVMPLQSGEDEIHFKPRLIEGVSLPGVKEPERLVLDGLRRVHHAVALKRSLGMN
jgi:uncharacterized protein with ParB-like and HNH nuclease domain